MGILKDIIKRTEIVDIDGQDLVLSVPSKEKLIDIQRMAVKMGDDGDDFTDAKAEFLGELLKATLPVEEELTLEEAVHVALSLGVGHPLIDACQKLCGVGYGKGDFQEAERPTL